MTNHLIGQAQLDDVAQIWGNSDLRVVTCGSIPPNPSELLGSSRMKEFLAEVEAHFDYVILDSPPLGPVADAAVMSRLVDGVLLVVGAGSSKVKDLSDAISGLKVVNANILGIVANKLPNKGFLQGYEYSYEQRENLEKGRYVESLGKKRPKKIRSSNEKKYSKREKELNLQVLETSTSTIEESSSEPNYWNGDPVTGTIPRVSETNSSSKKTDFDSRVVSRHARPSD